MKFASLRIAGFKSFAEPLNLDVAPGLTGIVGPNGCGKSNLMEAVCWVMGETSFRQMRATRMDDVVFSGSALRTPALNAEIRLSLQTQADDELGELGEKFALKRGGEVEILRHLEREQSSVWRINGIEARARDVQLLFADAASGARSLALVRQGMIVELLGAKPQSRRRILEEAAGVAGLYVRRHDAELRLAASEQNIARHDELIASKQQQRNEFSQQAKEASRYRKLNESIREQESLLAYGRWARLQSEAAALTSANEEESATLATSETAHTAQQEAVEKANTEVTTTQAAARKAQAELVACSSSADTLQVTRTQQAQRLTEKKTQITQVQRDRAQVQTQLQDARAQLESLQQQQDALVAAAATPEKAKARQRAADAEARLRDTSTAYERAEARLQAFQGRAAADAHEQENRAAQLTHWQEQAAAGGKNLAAQAADIAELVEDANRARAQLAEEDDGVQQLQTRHSNALAESERARTHAAECEERWQARNTTHAETHAQGGALAAQWETLARLFPHAADGQESLLAQVKITRGYEPAFAAIVGEDAQAGLNAEAAQYWRDLEKADAPRLPAGARPMTEFVTAPPALARLLAYVGVVDPKEGERLQKQLRGGQILVSQAGDVWRWDGYVAQHKIAQSRMARHRQLRNWQSLQQQRARVDRDCDRAKRELEVARQARDTATAAAQKWRDELPQASEALARAQTKREATHASLAQYEARCARLQERMTQEAEEHGRLQAELASAQALQSAAPAPEDGAALQSERDETHTAWTQARADHASLSNDESQARARLAQIQDERSAWAKRETNFAEQDAALAQRAEQGGEEIATLEAEQNAGTGEMSALEAARAAARDAVQAADAAAQEAQRAARAAQEALQRTQDDRARSREKTIASRTRRDMLQEQLREAGDAIESEFHLRPEGLREHLGDKANKLPPAGTLESALERARARRETMGQVNLRAEDDAARLDEELSEMRRQRDEIESAIAVLRRAINALNKEGERRLQQAFREVNAHFQELFATLFDGGEAQLRLDDPNNILESGLDVLVRVPGKKKQSLTLLSGGEQTLTALALIFAVFRTNPAPLCILDEADAQLDDGNVGRYCRLLQKIQGDTGTKFWLITHHPLTMSRMDRLIGVTMQEPGVSHISAVSLQEAERYAEGQNEPTAKRPAAE